MTGFVLPGCEAVCWIEFEICAWFATAEVFVDTLAVAFVIVVEGGVTTPPSPLLPLVVS